MLDGKTADSVTLLYGLPAPVKNPALVDDFAGYYGDAGLLAAAYQTNCGSGCSVSPNFAAGEDGSAALDFAYTLAPHGYAGLVKSLGGVDWSAYSGISFWVKPDGKGQKLICQINSHGEDFEVDLSRLTQGTAAQVVTIPFKDFVGKNGGTFDPSAVQHFAIYCNATGEKAVASHLSFDSIHAVN